MFRAMRIGTDLRTKALLALKEATQECRFGRVRQTYALRFALAYLWGTRRGDRACFVDFWRALDGDNNLFRFQSADRALMMIYREFGIERDDGPSWRFWSEANKRRQRESEGSKADQ
jgi:hypothetical protein